MGRLQTATMAGAALVLVGGGLIAAAGSTGKPLSDQALYWAGLVLIAFGLICGAVFLVIQADRPVLRLSLPKHAPWGFSRIGQFKSADDMPYEIDSRMSGGTNFVPTRFSSVWVLPLEVRNRGSVQARAVQANVIEARPRSHAPLPQKLTWRRTVVEPLYEQDLPPRGGNAQVCLVERNPPGGPLPPADRWEDPSSLTIVVSCEGARARIRVHVGNIHGDPTAKRLRWWQR